MRAESKMRQCMTRMDTSVGGIHAFFLVRGDPRTYNLPPKPEVPTIYLKDGWRSAGLAAGMLVLGRSGCIFEYSGEEQQKLG